MYRPSALALIAFLERSYSYDRHGVLILVEGVHICVECGSVHTAPWGLDLHFCRLW
jgi:hypothetical protein